MSVKKIIAVAMIAFTAACSVIIGHAEETVGFLQTSTWEEYLDIYLQGEIDLDSLNCKISNQKAEIVDSGFLADRDVAIYTTILVDTSMSIPEKVRASINSYLDMLIRDISENEKYRLLTFGEKLEMLQEFTGDRYDLAVAAEKIEFDSPFSSLYDAVYHTIPEIETQEGKACYYRTILITDTTEDSTSSITKEELYLNLQEKTYPLDIIAVTKKKQKTSDRNLSALARISGGREENLYPKADVSALSEAFALDKVFWIRIKVPVELLDGAVRQVDISDGTQSLQMDVKIPAFDMPVILEDFSEPKNEENMKEITKAAVKTDSNSQPKKRMELLLLVAFALLCFATIIIFVLFRALKKKRTNEHTKLNPYLESGQLENQKIGNKTEIMSNTSCLRLRNKDNTDQIWEILFSREIIIGRDSSSQVCLTDMSVSYKQCKLYLVNRALMIENLSNSNITQLNGEILERTKNVKEGDTIKCGRITLQIEAIQISYLEDKDDLNKRTKYTNV